MVISTCNLTKHDRRKTIGFASDLVPGVKTEEYYLTYRLVSEKYSNLKIGENILAHESGINQGFAVLEITKKDNALFQDLKPDAEGHQKYPNKETMRQVFVGYYGREIPDDEPMIILGFKLISLTNY